MHWYTMGTNCAPFLANLFLFAYERSYIDSMVLDGNTDLAMLLSNTFRYQDDCIIFNDHGTFSTKWNEIYPPEMQLVKTNEGNKCNLLDLHIEIADGKFTYRKYDKRADFNFEVINYPFLGSNIPQQPSYGVFISQLIRFCEINCNVSEFKSDIDLLVTKLVAQNFDIDTIKIKFHSFFKNNIIRWSKFHSDIEFLLG